MKDVALIQTFGGEAYCIECSSRMVPVAELTVEEIEALKRLHGTSGDGADGAEDDLDTYRALEARLGKPVRLLADVARDVRIVLICQMYYV